MDSDATGTVSVGFAVLATVGSAAVGVATAAIKALAVEAEMVVSASLLDDCCALARGDKSRDALSFTMWRGVDCCHDRVDAPGFARSCMTCINERRPKLYPAEPDFWDQ